MTNQHSTGSWNSTSAIATQNVQNGTHDFWTWHQSEMEKYAIYRAAPLFGAYGHYFLFAVGCPCNVITVITLLTIFPRTSTIIMMIALAVADTLTLAIPVIGYAIVHAGVTLGDVGCGLFIGITNYCIPTFPAYIMVMLTCERAIAVCFPLKAASICTVMHAKQSLLAIALYLAALCALPSFAYRKTQNGFNRYCSVDRKYVDAMHIYSYIKGVLSFVLPWIVMFICNVMIITKLGVSRRDHHEILRGPNTDEYRKKQNRSITAMLLTVSIAALILLGPSAVAAMVRRNTWAYVGDPEHDAMIYFFNRLRTFITTANSAVNFILYFLTGKRFREAFLALISCK